jgi:polysaccharide pyruvyl transferase WcaK-like protein
LPVSSRWWQVGPWRLRKWLRVAAILATEPWRRMRMRQSARDFDMLLISGTGIADDFYQDPLEVPLRLSQWCRIMRAKGLPVRFVSIGAGPIDDGLSVRWFRQALRAADFRSYRDHSSHDFALSIGVDAAADRVAPDLVFGLPLRGSERQAAWPPRVIGLGVMGYYGWNAPPIEGERIYADYLRKLVRLTDELLARGFDIRLLVGQRRDDRRPVGDVVRALADRSGAGRGKLLAGPIASYRDVMVEIEATDLVVATRFHNVLLALLLERPVISIEYGKKNADLMSAVGLAQYCHFVETFDPDAVRDQVIKMAAEQNLPTTALQGRLPEYRRLLEEQYDGVLRF